MQKGFSLMELLIAMTLAVIVMIAIVEISTMMTRQHLGAIHKEEVGGFTLAALDAMNKDVENASTLFYPQYGASCNPGNGCGDVMGGCINWSVKISASGGAGPLDPNQPTGYFIYCVTGLNPSNQFGSLYRYSKPAGGVCPTFTNNITNFLPGGCGANDVNGLAAVLWVGGNTTKKYGISHADACPSCSSSIGAGGDLGPLDPSVAIFVRTRQTNGLAMHYIVGNSTPTADSAATGPGHYVAHYFKVDTKVDMTRSFNNTND